MQCYLQYLLGKWGYESKRHDIFHEAFMFSLKVTEELVQWPEMVSRNRKWVRKLVILFIFIFIFMIKYANGNIYVYLMIFFGD